MNTHSRLDDKLHGVLIASFVAIVLATGFDDAVTDYRDGDSVMLAAVHTIATRMAGAVLSSASTDMVLALVLPR